MTLVSLRVSTETCLNKFYIDTPILVRITVSNFIQVLTHKLNKSKAINLQFRQNYLRRPWISTRIVAQHITSKRKGIKILTRLTCEASLSPARRPQDEKTQGLFLVNQLTLPRPRPQQINEERLLSTKLITLWRNSKFNNYKPVKSIM
jgi:hypothetical protein